VTKSDKARFAKKAKAFGLSISEFARTAMDRFDPAAEEEKQALDGLLEQVKRGSAEAERALDHVLAFCTESNARLARLDAWMRKKGYA
jgi:hypothetical protein